MNIIDILDNLLEYQEPHQHIHLEKKKNQYYSKLKNLCLPVMKLNLLKIEKSLFNLF